MKKIRMIGLTGRAGSGKDTAGALIREWIARDFSGQFNGYRAMVYGIADPLRDALTCFIRRAVPREEKEIVNPVLGISPREFMQKSGDFFRQMMGEDILLRLLGQRIREHRHTIYIITDVRLDIEAAFIREHGGIIIAIQRDAAGLDGAVSQHRTEQGVSPSLVNYMISNNGGMDELCRQIDLMMLCVTEGKNVIVEPPAAAAGLDGRNGQQIMQALKKYVLDNFGNIQEHSWKRYYIPQIIDNLQEFDLEEIKHCIKELVKEHLESVILEPTSLGVMRSPIEKYIHIAKAGYHSHLNINVKLIYQLQREIKND
ncbi:MAG: hypothetical protein WCV67_03005 [Victivallaceae bacterium]